jgi:hypothetical protein
VSDTKSVKTAVAPDVCRFVHALDAANRSAVCMASAFFAVVALATLTLLAGRCRRARLNPPIEGLPA